MIYIYRCGNEECSVATVEVNKPMMESGKMEVCGSCKERLTRVYNSPAIITGDGSKG